MTSGLTGLTGLSGLVSADEPQVSTFMAGVASAGGTVSGTNRSLMNGLINDLKSSGVLPKIQRMFFPSGSDSFAGAMVPLIDTLGLGNSTSTVFSSGDWSASGLTGKLNAYVDFKYNPLTHLASANSLCIYISTVFENFSARQFEYPRLYGAKVDNNNWLNLEQNFTTYYRATCYKAGESPTQSSQLSSGDVVVNRSAVNLVEMRNNGAVVSSSATSRSGNPPNLPLFLFAENVNGTPGDYSLSKILCFCIGQSLTSTEQAALRSAIAAYKTAKGI
jgi:hypothetical protein